MVNRRFRGIRHSSFYVFHNRLPEPNDQRRMTNVIWKINVNRPCGFSPFRQSEFQTSKIFGRNGARKRYVVSNLFVTTRLFSEEV